MIKKVTALAIALIIIWFAGNAIADRVELTDAAKAEFDCAKSKLEEIRGGL